MKKVIFLLVIITAAFIITGCGPKVNVIKGKQSLNGEIETTYIVEGTQSWNSPSGGHNIATRNRHILLNAAKATQKEGKAYFAIYKPDAISNITGSTINTPEEFMEECMPSGANIITVGNERCGFDGKHSKAGVIILMFDEQPMEYTTYDAQYVIDYMNKNGYEREDTWDNFIDKTK